MNRTCTGEPSLYSFTTYCFLSFFFSALFSLYLRHVCLIFDCLCCGFDGDVYFFFIRFHCYFLCNKWENRWLTENSWNDSVFLTFLCIFLCFLGLLSKIFSQARWKTVSNKMVKRKTILFLILQHKRYDFLLLFFSFKYSKRKFSQYLKSWNWISGLKFLIFFFFRFNDLFFYFL